MIVFLALLLAVSIVINFAMFLIAYKRRSDKLTDISYALSFIILTFIAYATSEVNLYSFNLYNFIGLAMIVFWAVRIGGFLLYRVVHVGKDKRFDVVREDFTKFGKFWVGQAVTVWVLLIPFALASRATGSISWLAIIGLVTWLTGLLIEALADHQKFDFAQNKSNKNKWIDSGVWKFSRHPNYFGEILVWIGIYLYALPALSLVGALVGLVSPLLIVTLLVFVTGIPILEKSADNKWGKLEDYKKYKQQTSLLIPRPKSRAE